MELNHELNNLEDWAKTATNKMKSLADKFAEIENMLNEDHIEEAIRTQNADVNIMELLNSMQSVRQQSKDILAQLNDAKRLLATMDEELDQVTVLSKMFNLMESNFSDMAEKESEKN